MHLERGCKDQKAWPDKLLVQMMIPQNMTDVLAKEAFDALAKFLDAIDVRLGDAPGAVRRVGRPWFEFLDFFLNAKIPRNIGRQIAEDRKGSHGLDRDRLVERDRVQSRHAHELGHAIDFRRTGT